MSKMFNELIKERQSCRNFSEKPVDKKLLYEITADAVNAPSACNSQPWRVFVASCKTDVDKMKTCLQDEGKNPFLNNAQAFIAIFESNEVCLRAGTETRFSSNHFVEYDVGEFIAYLTLSAKDKGLDSCIIGWVNNEKINSAFNLRGKCNIVVAFGYGKDNNVRKKSRLNIKDIILNYEE